MFENLDDYKCLFYQFKKVVNKEFEYDKITKKKGFMEGQTLFFMMGMI